MKSFLKYLLPAFVLCLYSSVALSQDKKLMTCYSVLTGGEVGVGYELVLNEVFFRNTNLVYEKYPMFTMLTRPSFTEEKMVTIYYDERRSSYVAKSFIAKESLWKQYTQKYDCSSYNYGFWQCIWQFFKSDHRITGSVLGAIKKGYRRHYPTPIELITFEKKISPRTATKVIKVCWTAPPKLDKIC